MRARLLRWCRRIRIFLVVVGPAVGIMRVYWHKHRMLTVRALHILHLCLPILVAHLIAAHNYRFEMVRACMRTSVCLCALPLIYRKTSPNCDPFLVGSFLLAVRRGVK